MSTLPTQSATASATGKVILLGEHFVLYGLPALVAGIDRALHLTVSPCATDQWQTPFPLPEDLLDRAAAARDCIREELGITGQHAIAVNSALPLQANLGSSAALCVALTRALALLNQEALPAERLLTVAQAGEAAIHGKSSGIDTTMAALGGIRRFGLIDTQLRNWPVALSLPLHLIVVTTKETTSTATMIERVRAWVDGNKAKALPLFGQYRSNFDAALTALASSDVDALGHCLNQGHHLLTRIGVSTAALDTFCTKARSLGAPGAKLTGGGGGGSALILCRNTQQQSRLTQTLAEFGTPYPVTIANPTTR